MSAKSKQRLNLSLDQMADIFHSDPSQRNARRYRDVALEYWEDEMISDETLICALKEIRNG